MPIARRLRRLNKRSENSHQPFRRGKRGHAAVSKREDTAEFRSVHAQVHNHFDQERHLVTREICKQRRSAALGEWRGLMARTTSGIALPAAETVRPRFP